ncbi:MAG TPA: N-acetylmuramic acid 6-phosphate etherase [Pyrinomonadaceae bacterium]|jgi:N-acetylmuramic acid 6-phosphate etherase|nr:N-acetylmuramic acid 6-phosphate etherase [Pyrinomonadaceae bacterium]
MNHEIVDSLPITEQENPRSENLSALSSADIIALMNEEDAVVARAVQQVLVDVAKAVDEIVVRLRAGGRLFYIGTGTSGRLGVLDASECPPTFGVSPELVQGVIAGGYDACHRAVEASEDDAGASRVDLQQRGFNKGDVLVGIAASGRTPYTVGAVSYARELGAFAVGLTCVPDSPITKVAEVSIVPVVGPEVLTGSSRLKAGTAQKMVLNMLSTATMVRLGYVSGNRMSNVQAKNVKLRDRALRILMKETGLETEAAAALLEAAATDLSVALVMTKGNSTREEAKEALQKTVGKVEEAVQLLRLGRN